MFSQYCYVQLLNYSIFEQFCFEIYKLGTSMLSLSNYMRETVFFLLQNFNLMWSYTIIYY